MCNLPDRLQGIIFPSWLIELSIGQRPACIIQLAELFYYLHNIMTAGKERNNTLI